MADNWLIYGANGYTGELVARLAVARGEHPILAGRNAQAVRALAAELGLEARVADLRNPAALAEMLDGVSVAAHCAGPFSETAAPMVDACLATRTHYVDITGEIEVFDAVYQRHDEAVAAGIVLLPGAGFDVVPTDCLAANLAAALPSATSLELAFRAGGGPSPGTAKTSIAGMALGGRVRRDGELVPSPAGTPRRSVPFPSGDRDVAAIRWGDLVSAYRSTGIPNITTYTVLPGGGRGAGMSSVMKSGPVQAVAMKAVEMSVSGPDAAKRAATGSEVWGEVRDASGASVSGTLVAPNGYDLTADSTVRVVQYLATGTGILGPVAPGAHTPVTAFGAGYAETLDGVTLSIAA